MQTNQITKKTREQQELTLRAFADAINAKLVNTSVTHSTVSRWEDEVTYYEPDLSLLFECVATYRYDWRAQWAVNCIHAMYPDLVESGVISFSLPNGEPVHVNAT
jgi:transcriptional regulator with XRE-family HTH domain